MQSHGKRTAVLVLAAVLAIAQRASAYVKSVVHLDGCDNGAWAQASISKPEHSTGDVGLLFVGHRISDGAKIYEFMNGYCGFGETCNVSQSVYSAGVIVWKTQGVEYYGNGSIDWHDAGCN
jgi:hypothetical protein